MSKEPGEGMHGEIRVRVAPARAPHRAVVALAATSEATGMTGGKATSWQEGSRVLRLAQLGFRWAWDLVGSTGARCGGFLAGPRRVAGCTTMQVGGGLGLSLAYGIVEDSCGRPSLDQYPAGGARFDLELGRARGAAEHAP